MTIQLKQVYPIFFAPPQGDGSQVWKQVLDFNQGSHVHIIAPSGSGKTSLIHFLYGLKKDYSGDIFYNSVNIKNFDAVNFSIWRQHHISIVFQDLRLFTEQTVLQNLAIKRMLSPYHPEDKIRQMAARLGIENKLGQLCKHCSYGEQQRIAIIRSLLQPFDFLLLDEPFSHLDEANRMKAMELVEEEAAARKASIILADLKELTYFKAERKLHL